ncbi:MAG: DUF4395 domain-containing protein [SAR202 cluster bacterium]|nr:DUF4395 domain-containing protein [SAR202 cluster bacterium]
MNENITNFFSFPELINEVSARLVAIGVLVLSSVVLFLLIDKNNYVLIFLSILIYGFLARVSSGPKISPLALFVTKLLVPRLNFKEKLVPGPPKRFAQGIGLIFSLSTAITFLINLNSISIILISTLILFAALEAFIGFCAGCKVFKLLMNIGLIPNDVCEKCSNYQF